MDGTTSIVRRAASPSLPTWTSELVMLPAVLLLMLVFATLGVDQFSVTTIESVVGQNSTAAIAAAGLTVVLLNRGLDLAVGATAATCGVIAATTMIHTGSVVLGFLAAMASGMVIGTLIGGVITRLTLEPFVATLAALYLLNGVTLVATKGATVAPVPNDITESMLREPLGVPVPVIVVVAVFVLGQLALWGTKWGREVALVGANRRTAALSGIGVRRVSLSTYAFSSACAGLAGALLAARVGGASASTGTPLLFTAIGAVVIGGTSLFGGRGSLIRTAVGVLFLSLLTNGLQQLGYSTAEQAIATGLVVIAGVALDTLVISRKQRQV
ncbi:MAG TPA: ABC transporter permease [Solirubrobacterales bacterium]|nr:ABC transporter permease [Solirubrobacterales bacterium]